MPGPPPKPAAIKILEGNLGRRPIPQQPEFQITEIPPAWLDGEAKEIWAQLAPTLVKVKILTEADAQTLGRYCHLLSTWLKLAKIIEKTGTAYAVYERHKIVTEIEHPDGRKERKIAWEKVQNGMRTLPQARHYQTINTELLKMESHFGMTPASRARIKLGESSPLDPVYDDSDLE